ncbi:MAG: lysine--tRNA ligase [Thermoplasmata archaeon]|nr:lysine--tRNA ligase [Thermoplasmata archaeon]MCI4359768.1 lysine--tRNA ligase [Thermoplasmata archaeon]
MDDDPTLVKERRAKALRLRAEGREPFPWAFPGRVPTEAVANACKSIAQGEADPTRSFRVAGRIRAVRGHGRSAFLDLDDLSGSLQLYARVDELGENGLARLLADTDPGDLLGADGVPVVTRRGEPSLRVTAFEILAKALNPPPEKYHGLQDPEERIRRRYVDLLASPESRARFRTRSLLTRALRRHLDGLGFLEVETPTLVPIASGAAAQPFTTRSRYLDRELQLRIALELPLKRLLVGGLERVYEVGHVFRNEDMDSTHAPEFTMMELYWAYADYTDMRGLLEGLYGSLALEVAKLLPGSPAAQEAPARFRAPFPTVDFVEELERRSGIRDLLGKSREELRALARSAGATVPEDSPPGKFLDKLFEHYVEPTLDRPTFVLDFPESTTPLAKRHRSRPGRVERFELFARGIELGNAYTELNDPDEQERRFREQLSSRGEDHYAYDSDFVEALRFGMPPATGLGIGIDRMVMALTGTASIKDVILFLPTRERSPG